MSDQPTSVEVPAKRSADKVPVSFDLHDYLASTWGPGVAFQSGERIRNLRKLSTGLEYEVTTGGVTDERRPIFPRLVGATVQSGSVIFTARAMSTASLRTTVASAAYTATGLTLSDQGVDDLVYTTYAAGGTSGQKYAVKLVATLSNAPPETVELVALLPVQD